MQPPIMPGKMLPAIFRTDDPLMQVAYATDERIKLESILDGMENTIFTADDALGWVYQFWQSEAKANLLMNSGDEKLMEKNYQPLPNCLPNLTWFIF